MGTLPRWRFFQEQAGKLWLSVAFIVVSVLAFEAGALHQGLREPEPVLITTPASIEAATVPARGAVTAPRPPETSLSTSSPDVSADCMFVGSKKSNKYHVPTSRCAKQIKTENRICFTSVEAAQAKGYVAGCLE